MSFLLNFVQAVQSWRRHRGANRTRMRADLGLEQLDHRRLMTVNFSGNIAADFPATQSPGVVYLSDPNNQQPIIPPSYLSVIPVSGFAINQIAVNYNSTTDTLNVGFLQPLNGKPGLDGIPGEYPVIAGDADDNGNNSTTSTAAANLVPAVADNPGISGQEYMGAFIDFSNGANPGAQTVYAGIPPVLSPTDFANSTYTVAQAVYQGGQPVAAPGGQLPQYEGNVYVPSNDPRHGALEFSIDHFSQLYQQETGHALTPQSVISIGATAGSGADGGISEEFFHAQPLTIANATTPVSPPPPPPPPPVVCVASPPVLINPHENRHVNTAHQTLVRVTVLSSSGFDATQINPSTVNFGGAAPIAEFPRIQLHDGLPSETFVFKGTDINLPPGLIEAPITGKLNNGQAFSSGELIFNRNDSFYSQARINARDARLARIGATVAQEQANAAALAAQRQAAFQAVTAQQLAGNDVLASQLAAEVTAGSNASTASATPAFATNTVRITPRQERLAGAFARRASMVSGTVAPSFRVHSAHSAHAPSSTRIGSSLLAHDLALQSIGSGAA